MILYIFLTWLEDDLLVLIGKIGDRKVDVMSDDIVTIKNIFTGETFASAQKSKGVRMFEGAWYFEPDKVDMTNLIVSERTYTCPYKGVCYWIDLQTPEHQAEDVAFVYFKVNPGYEFVKDRIGFYAGMRGATFEE